MTTGAARTRLTYATGAYADATLRSGSLRSTSYSYNARDWVTAVTDRGWGATAKLTIRAAGREGPVRPVLDNLRAFPK